MTDAVNNASTTDAPGKKLPDGRARISTGLIGVFTRHPTASNLLMAILILLGFFGALRMNTQFFPTIEVPVITVTVPWSGASAADVEANILNAIEPEIRFIDGIDEVISIAREGAATLTLEFQSDADMQKAQSDIEQAVARITTLPEDAEEPTVSRAVFFEPVANISVAGPFSEAALKDYAKRLRDGLLNSGIDSVSFNGARSEEIVVELDEYQLRRLDLTPADVASSIGANSTDRPSGIAKGAVDVQLRALSQRRTPEELASIPIKALPSGEFVTLGDVARIERVFDDDDDLGLKGSVPAIELTVKRAVSADTLKVMNATLDYVEKAKAQFPQTLEIDVYDVRGKLVQQRLGILVKNGLQGLVLVLIVLFIFLDFRVAFWTAAGIPVAFLGTLAVMFASDQSINMISMFALIMMLGIIVDDAIVVGEHTATLQARGYSGIEAAEFGAHRMFKPVVAATLTTPAAFLPIVLIRGTMGDIMFAIPLVVTAVLAASLVESFLILPGHMRHGARASQKRRPGWFRRNFDGGLAWFRDGPFRAMAEFVYDWRYLTMAAALAAFILSIGLIVGGRVGFTFFPSPESENITASVFFGAGTPRRDQIAAIGRIETALADAERNLLADVRQRRARERQNALAPNERDTNAAARAPSPDAATGPSAVSLERLSELVSDGVTSVARLAGFSGNAATKDRRLVENVFVTLGKAGRAQGENIASVAVQLTPSEARSVRTKTIVQAWRRAIPEIPGVERLAIGGRRAGPPGRDVDVRLQQAPVEDLKAAAEELADKLTTFPGVSGISDDLPYGRPELALELTPRGQALGFTGDSVGAQVRNAFEGAVATRFARDDEEVTVRVMRSQAGDGLAALNRIYLRSPTGRMVPLDAVVTVREKQGFSIIQRRDGVRTVSVTGDIDAEVTSVDEVVARLQRDVMPQLAEQYGVRYEFKGRDEERRESFADLQAGALLAMALIYIILAWVFESYAKPLAVMAIIPFGLVGAILGHMAMGANLTIISMIGLLGLSGILVNDSIILVTQVKERLTDGDDLRAAAIGASQDRLRAVLLTSLTTVGGLLPLLFEESRQAQFLIPMAITLVFGLTAATLLVLFLVPALMGLGGDVGRIGRGLAALYTPRRPAPEGAE